MAAAAASAAPETVAAPEGGSPPRTGIIAEGVSIEGLDVGGLTRQAAASRVLKKRVAARRRPVPLEFLGRRLRVDPVALGYRADVDYAVRAAYAFGHSRPLRKTMEVPLPQQVNGRRLRAVLRAKAARLEIPAVNGLISFRGFEPALRRPRAGARVKLGAAQRVVKRAILTRRKRIYRLPVQRVRPLPMRQPRDHPTVVLIERERFELTLFKDGKRRSFRVAVGTREHPTPAGSFWISRMERDPTWIPPSSPWARGIGPVPPGTGNPLGTRWIGTTATEIGIHGTRVTSSLGTRASHGCIRMSIPTSEWLYDRIRVGTAVVIR